MHEIAGEKYRSGYLRIGLMLVREGHLLKNKKLGRL